MSGKTVAQLSEEVNALNEKIELVKEIEKIKADLNVAEKKIESHEKLIRNLAFWIITGAVLIWLAAATGFTSWIITQLPK